MHRRVVFGKWNSTLGLYEGFGVVQFPPPSPAIVSAEGWRRRRYIIVKFHRLVSKNTYSCDLYCTCTIQRIFDADNKRYPNIGLRDYKLVGLGILWSPRDRTKYLKVITMIYIIISILDILYSYFLTNKNCKYL